jgi:CheY-like chemotaxis protein
MASTILVVDDEKFIVEAISQHLDGAGYDVVGMINSTQAMETIQERDFDLVLTDLRMPDVSGMDLARAVHAKDTDTQVIILTGYATLDSAIESVRLDVYAYLNKPFELRELGQVVDRALTEQRLKRDNEALQANVAKLLDDVSTLYEVTRFLYDTNDWTMATEFVLDTLSIGLGLTYSGLLLKAEDGQYHFEKTNFPAGSRLVAQAETCSWELLDTMVSSGEPTYLENGEEASSLFEALSTPGDPLQGIQFTPIRYHEILLGYLIVFVAGETAVVSDNSRKLLQILAIQIAPLVYQSRSGDVLEHTQGRGWHVDSQNLFERYLADQTPDEPIGISLLRFVTPRDLASLEELTSFHAWCSDMLLRHEPESTLYWLGADTAMAFFPRTNQVQAEIACMALADDFHRTELTAQKKEDAARLFYGSASWPQDDLAIPEFLTGIWALLMNRIHNYAKEQVALRTEDDGNEFTL